MHYSQSLNKYGYNGGGKDMNSKKMIMIAGIFFIALFILNIYASLLLDVRYAASQLDVNRMIILHVSAMLVCFMFGVLLEWKHLLTLFSKKQSIKLTFSFYLGIFLLLVGLLPPIFYEMELSSLHLPFPKRGIGINMLFGMFNQFSNVQAILSVTAGTLFIKGLYQKG